MSDHHTEAPVREERNRKGEWAIIVVFLAALGVPFLGSVWQTTRHVIRARRAGQSAPLGKSFLYGVRDDALGQALLRNLYARLVVVGLRSSPNESVAVGPDGWLFSMWDHESLPYYRRTRPFSEEDLRTWRKVLRHRREWFARRGIVYLMVIAPNKATIYPQYVPRRITRADGPTRLDQFMANLTDEDRAVVVDLRPVLKKAAAERRAYWKTDTHWNQYGSYRAYVEVMRRLAERRPGGWADPITEIGFPTREIKGMGLAEMLKCETVLWEVHHWMDWKIERRAKYVPLELDRLGVSRPNEEWPAWTAPAATEIRDPRLPGVVVFRDSFFGGFFACFPEHFSRGVYVWSGNFVARDRMTNTIDVKLIDSEKPDIVIEEFVERYLIHGPPSPDIE